MALGLLSMGALIYVDNEIATRYNQSSGKTRAMFGIVELLEFNYRYLILIPATISIVLIFNIIRLKKFKIWDVVILLIGLITIVGTVTSSWRLLT